MSLDLNGTVTTGNDYITSYIDDTTPGVGIVSSGVRVGSGSTTANTDGVDKIRLHGNWRTGDYLQISTLPTGLELSGAGIPSGATSWTGLVQGDVYIQRVTPSTTVADTKWQAALQCVSFYNLTPGTGPSGATELTRSIGIDTLNASGATISHATSTINIDNRPEASPDTNDATEAGGVNNASGGMNPFGNVLNNDFDDPADPKTVWAVSFGALNGTLGSALAGNYGSLVLNADGSYTYSVNNTNTAVQALRTNSNTLTEVFNYTIRDAAGQTSTSTLTLTLHGNNDAPVALADTAVASEAGGVNNGAAGVNPTGNVLSSDTDVDAGDTKAVTAVGFAGNNSAPGVSRAGAYGSLVLNADGSYTYTVNNAHAAVQALRPFVTLTDAFTYTMRDAAGLTSASTLTVTIMGANDAPVAVADVGTATEAGGVNNGAAGSNATGNVLTGGAGADTDVDANDIKAVTQVGFAGNNGVPGVSRAGAYGSLVLNADGSYTYTVNNNNAAVQALSVGQTLTDTFTYTMRDQAGLTSSTTLTITVQGANDAPTRVALGHWFDGTAGAVVTSPQLLDAHGSFTLEFKVTPTQIIALNAESNTGAVGIAGQHYAIAGLQGATTYGDASHAGIGVSVGTNGISVYQHTANVLSPLLSWGDTVTAETQVAIVFTNNTPTLYINGVAVRTGLHSTVANLHASLTVGGDAYGYFEGSVSDYRVWDNALSAAQISANLTRGVYMFEPGLMTMPMLSTSVTENLTQPGTVVGNAHATDPEGGAVSYSLVGDAGGRFVINAGTGQISVANGAQFDYETAKHHDLVVRATDGQGLANDSTVRVGVVNVVEAPQAVADAGSAHVGEVAQGNVLTNDTPIEIGDTKTVIGVGVLGEGGSVGQPLQGMYGTLTLRADGTYDYLVDNANTTVRSLRNGDTLNDVFTYRVSGNDQSTWNETTLTLSIAGANDAPVAVADSASATSSGVVFVNGAALELIGTNPTGNVLTDPLSGDIDPDTGDTKTVAAVSFSGTNGTTNGTVGSALAGAHGSLLLNADGSYTYSLNNADAAVRALRPGGGTLTDTFTYTVQDAAGATSSTTLTLTIHGQNDAPVAVADSAQASSSGVASVGGIAIGLLGTNPTGNVLSDALSGDTDPDTGDTKTVSAVKFGSTVGMLGSALAGAHGSLVLNADGSYTYSLNNDDPAVRALRPGGGMLSDIFSYTMRDAAGVPSSSTLTVTIVGLNDAPVAVAETASAQEAGGLLNNIPGIDPQGDVLQGRNVDVDSGDTVTVTAVSFNGTGGITNGAVGSAVAGAYGSLVLSANGHYVYTVDNNNAAVQALRTNGDTLVDTFSYTVTDATGMSSTSTLAVTVHGANDTPVAVVDTGSAKEAGGVDNGTPGWNAEGNVLTNDTDPDAGDPKSVAVDTGWVVWNDNGGRYQLFDGAYGTLRLYENGSYTYTVNNANAAGQALRTSQDRLTESFGYTVLDTAGASSSATLTIEIQGANDAPATVVIEGTAHEAGGVNNAMGGSPATGNVLANASAIDPDAGDTLHVSFVDGGLLQQPGQNSVGQLVSGNYGALVLQANGDYTYTPYDNLAVVQALRTSGQTLSESFYYEVSDAAGLKSGTNTLTVTIQGSNDAPVAASIEVTAQAAGSDPSGNFMDHVSDVDDGDSKALVTVHGANGNGPVDFLGHTLVAGTYGTLELGANGSYTYTVDSSNANVKALGAGQTLAEQDVFDYDVVDAAGTTGTGQLKVTVQGVNDAPVATGGSATMAEDGFARFNVQSLGKIDLGDGVLVDAVKILTLPPASQATLLLNGEPVMQEQTIKLSDVPNLVMKSNIFTPEAFGFSDVDSGDHLGAVRIETLPDPDLGQLVLNGEPVGAGDVVQAEQIGNLSFQPISNYNGPITFSYKALDAAGVSSAQASTFTLNITPVNDAPTITAPDVLSVREADSTRLTELRFFDPDAGNATQTLTLHVEAGTLTATPNAAEIGAGVHVSGSGTDTLVLTGTQNALYDFVKTGSGVNYDALSYPVPTLETTVQRLSDGDDPIVRFTLRSSAGTFVTPEHDGITVTGSDTDIVTVQGHASEVYQYIANELGHRSMPNTTILDIRLNDGGTSGEDPGLTGGAGDEEQYQPVLLNVVRLGHELPSPMILDDPAVQGVDLAAAVSPGTVYTIGSMMSSGWEVPSAPAGSEVHFMFEGGIEGVFNSVKEFFFGNGEGAGGTNPDEVELIEVEGKRYRVTPKGPRTEFGQDYDYVELPGPPGDPGGPGTTLPVWLVELLKDLALGVVITAGTALTAFLAYRASVGDTEPNDRPVVTFLPPEGEQGLPVKQDHDTTLTGLHVTDDSGSYRIDVVLSVPEGEGILKAVGIEGKVDVLDSGTHRLSLRGTLADINQFLDGGSVTYTSALHASGDVTLHVEVDDNGASGVDPGTSGESHSEVGTLDIQLNIQPVNHAPSSVDHSIVMTGTEVVLSVEDFGFIDTIDPGSSLKAVIVDTLPDTGSLWLVRPDGVRTAVTAGQAILASDIAAGKLIFTQAQTGTPSDSTSFTFRVQDNGGTDHGGVDTDPYPRMFTLTVDHAVSLDVGNPVVFDEGQQTQAYLTANASVTEVDNPREGITTVRLTVVEPRPGDSWAADLVRFADAYEALYPGQTAPAVTLNADDAPYYELTFSGGVVPIEVAEALIESLVFRNDSPNLDEGPRQFTVQLVDQYGVASNASTISVEVVSIFGALERALGAELQSIAGHVSQTGSPVASFAAEQHHDLMQWLAHRGQLADAVWNALSKASSPDGLIEMGGSLIAALSALRVDYRKAQFSLTPSLTDYVAQADDLIAIDPVNGGAHLSSATQVALLKQLAAIRDESAQQRYFELARALSTATEAGIDAWQAEGAAWTITWLDDLGILDAAVVQSADPQTHLAQNPSALVQDAAGNLWAAKDTLKQIVTAIDVHRINNLAKNSSYVEIAGHLLTHGSAAGTVWAVDMSVLHWLDAAGIEREAVVELEANADPLVALSEAGSLGSLGGKLLMSPATLNALTQALATATESSQGSSAASELRALLTAANAANGGPYTLSNDHLHLLEEAGVHFRSVTELTSSSLAGEIAQADANAAATFTAQTRAALLAQLEAIEAKANAVPANVMALSSVVEALEDLQRATDTSFYGRTLKEVAVSDEVLAALQSQGLQIDDVSGFSTAERDLILPARLHMIGDATRVYGTGDTLLVPADMVDALLRGLAQDLQFLGLDLATAAVPEDGDSPQISTDHAAQPPGMQSPTLDKAWLLQETAEALDEIVQSSTQLSFTTTSSFVFQAWLFHADAADFRSLMASAGIALTDLGDVSSLNATQVAALQNAAEPAMGRDADGSLVLSQATAEALQMRLTAQYFRERADLAQAAFGVLLKSDTDARVTVVQADGSLDDAVASTLGEGLIVVSDSVLDTLAQLGVSMLALHARTSQPTAADIAALSTDGRFLLDEANHTLVMSAQTHAALLLQVAAQMRASQIAYYTNNPAAIDDARYDTPTEMAFNLLDAATVDSALTAAMQQTGIVVELAVTSDILARLRLTVLEAGRFDGSAEAQQALSRSALGTVQIDHDGHLWMSTATLDWLKLQLDTVQHPPAVPFDASTAGTRVAQLDRLLDQVRDSFLPEGEFVSLYSDSQFIQQLADVAGIVAQDLGAFDPEADPATYQLSTLTNAIAHGPGDAIVISSATHLAWTALLSAAARSAGGDLAGDHRFDLEGQQIATVQWAAKAEEVKAFNAIEAQLTPLLVGSNFVSSESGASYWRAPVGGSALSIAALVERLTGTVAIVDMGALDAGAASTIDALLSTTNGIARDAATGELLMSIATRQAVVDALVAELTQARQDLCAQAMQALLAADMRVDGLCVLRDSSVVQSLERLGLHDVTRLVLGNQPSFGELGIDGSTVLLNYQTLMQLISRIGSVEAVSATSRSEAAELMPALQAIEIDTDIIAVPASTGLSLSDGWLSIRDGGGYVGAELGRRNLLDSPIGTVQQGADGTFYMNAATFAALQAELGGLVANGWSSAAAATDSTTYLQGAAQLLSYLEELGTVKSVSPTADDNSTLPVARVGWWDVFGSWIVEPVTSDALQQSLGVDGGFVGLAEAFGIDLNVLTIATRESLITVLQNGALKQPYTVVVDANGNRLISKETRDGLIDALVNSVKRNTGVDWSPLYGNGAPAGDPLASALGIASDDTHSESLRRNLEQAPDDWRALSALARTLMAQLQLDHQDVSTGNLVYGTNSTSAVLTQFNEALPKFNGLKALTLVEPPVSGSLPEGTFAALGQGVLMTEQTHEALLERARLVATLSDIEASLQITEGLTGRVGANATVVSWDVSWLDSHSPLPLRALQVTSMDGSVHAIPYERMVAVYGQARNDSTGVSFGNQATNYTDPTTGQTVTVLKSVVLDAYAQLMNGSTVYALSQDGASAVMAYAAHGAGVGALMQGKQADKSVLVRILEDAVLTAVETVPEGVRVFYEGFKATLKGLGLDYLWSTSTDDADQPSTIVDLGDGSYVLSSETLNRVQAQIGTLQSHSTAAVGRALTELAETTPIYANSDFFRQTAKVDLLEWFATYGDMTQMVVSVRVDPDYLARLKAAQIVEEDPPHIANLDQPLLVDQEGLWDKGMIRTATVGGDTVLVMTLETHRWLEGRLDAGAAAPMHGLRNVDDAFLDALLAAGVRLDKVSHLRVGSIDKATFVDPVELDQVLDEAPVRTVFVDADGEHWISGATALALRAELQIALRATSSPVIELSPGELDARLDVYDAALPVFDGEALIALANGTSPAVVSFDADLIEGLATLGVNLTQVNSTSLLGSAPAFSYALEGDNATVSATTYASLSTQLPVAGYALQSSLFHNEWTKFSYTGADGNTHVYWQSAEAQNSNFVEAISRSKLPQLSNGGVPDGTVLDSFTQSSSSYMTDKFGQVIVSDATYALIRPALELRALTARTEFASAVDIAQRQAQTHHAEDLVLITDSALIQEIEALGSVKKTFRIDAPDPDVEDLSDAERDALGQHGAYAVIDGSSHHLLVSVATRDWLATQTSDGIPELEGAGTVVAQVPDVVEIKGSAIAAYLKDLLGVSLGQLFDEASQALPPAGVDGDNLSDRARRQLADVDRLVVLDKDGDLLMSADTWKTLVTAGRQSFAAAGTELTLELAEQLSQALPPVEVQANDGASQQLRALQGPYENWLKALDALGVDYNLVVNAQDVNGHFSTALFGGAASRSVGTDAGGRLVLSDRTFAELSAYVNQLQETYRGSEDAVLASVLASFYPGLPVDLSRFADVDGFNAGDTLSHSGAAARIRDAYTEVTNLRFMLNSGMYTDGTLLGDHWSAAVLQLPQILQGRPVAELLDVYRSVEGYAQELRSFAGPRFEMQRLGDIHSQSILDLVARAHAVRDAIAQDPAGHQLATRETELINLAGLVVQEYRDYREDVRAEILDTNTALGVAGVATVKLVKPTDIDTFVNTVQTQVGQGGNVRLDIALTWFDDIKNNILLAMAGNEARMDEGAQRMLASGVGSNALITAAQQDYAARAGAVATQFDDFSKQLQMMRAITSYLTYITSFAGKMHDATLASEMAGSVLGTSDAAEAARADYTWRMQKSYINAFQNFASPAQLVVHYVHKLGFSEGWGKFKNHLSKLPHQYTFSKNPYWPDAIDRAPYLEAVKDVIAQQGKGDFPLRRTQEWNVHVAQNSIYAIADLAWAATGAAVMYDLYHNRNATATPLENARFAADGTLGSLDFVTALSWFAGDTIALNTADRLWNQRGSRMLGVPLHFYLPLYVFDSVVATAEAWVAGGKGWAAATDKWVNTALYGLPYVLPQATPYMIALQLLRPSVEAVENYLAKANIAAQLTAQGRNTEAALMTRQATAELFKIIPVAGWFSWAYNLAHSNATSMTPDEYEQAVREIFAGRDLPTATDRPIDAILALAKQWGAEDNFYCIQGAVVDFPETTTDQIQVIKAAATWHVRNGAMTWHDTNGVHSAAQMSFYDRGLNIDGTENNFYNKAIIKVSASTGVDIDNKTGGRAVYLIDRQPLVQVAISEEWVPGPNIEVNVSNSTVDSTNLFVVKNPHVIIRGGASTDIYHLMQEMQTVYDAGQRIAGFISDGVDSPYRDVVSFIYAGATDAAEEKGHFIHSGRGYKGFSYYDGIHQYVGSLYDDVFTRYGSDGASDVWNDYSGSGGRDMFDLRSGNNTVNISGGTVHFDHEGSSSAWTNASRTKEFTEQEKANFPSGGPFDGSSAEYEDMFDNDFTASNRNVVNVTDGRAGTTFAVYGSSAATDSVMFSQWAAGGLRITSTGPTGDSVVQNLAGTTVNHGTFDGNVDAVWGTSTADEIVVGTNSGLTQVVGGGGADRITVEKAGVTVVTYEGDAVVRLGDLAAGSSVSASDGNTVIIETDAIGDAPVNVGIVGTPGGSGTWTNPIVVDASDAGADLYADMFTGSAHVTVGRDDSTIVINATADQITIVDNSARTGTMHLKFLDDDGTFATGQLIDEYLEDVVGNAGEYHAKWETASGRVVDIEIQYSNTQTIYLGAYEGSSVLSSLSSLVAELPPQPQPGG